MFTTVYMLGIVAFRLGPQRSRGRVQGQTRGPDTRPSGPALGPGACAGGRTSDRVGLESFQAASEGRGRRGLRLAPPLHRQGSRGVSAALQMTPRGQRAPCRHEVPERTGTHAHTHPAHGVPHTHTDNAVALASWALWRAVTGKAGHPLGLVPAPRSLSGRPLPSPDAPVRAVSTALLSSSDSCQCSARGAVCPSAIATQWGLVHARRCPPRAFRPQNEPRDPGPHSLPPHTCPSACGSANLLPVSARPRLVPVSSPSCGGGLTHCVALRAVPH